MGAHFIGVVAHGKVYIDNGVSALGRQTDGATTIAAVNHDATISLGFVGETDDFLTGQGLTNGAAVWSFCVNVLEESRQIALGAIGGDHLFPFGQGGCLWVSADFHTATVCEDCGKGSQLAVNARILCVFAEIALKGEV